MSVSRRIEKERSEVTIAVDGRFDFSQHKAFRDAYRDIDANAMRFVVDLSGTSYLDSSALGMLLLLREHAGGEEALVRIQGCGEDVRRVLRIVNFQQLFSID